MFQISSDHPDVLLLSRPERVPGESNGCAAGNTREEAIVQGFLELVVQPADEEIVIRVEFFGDEVEKITVADPLTGEIIGARDQITIFPASHFVTSEERLARAIVERRRR